MTMRRRLFIVGSTSPGSLEGCYRRAAEAAGWSVTIFDPSVRVEPFLRGGAVGRLLHTFLPVESWNRKMNRVLIDRIMNHQPDLLLVFANAPVSAGTLANIRLLCDCKFVWYWPDGLMNLTSTCLLAREMYDLSAIYSAACIGAFERMGFRETFWLPFAGDSFTHQCEPRDDGFDVELSFVGGWRPDRERALVSIVNAFPRLDVQIHGPYWTRDCKDAQVRRLVRGAGLYGADLSNFFNRSRINLNVIDSPNYPAANMRFFEVPIAGGLQLSSACPEQSGEYCDRRDVVYFSDETRLLESIEWVLSNPDKASAIRRSGFSKSVAAHTYSYRFRSLIGRVFGT